MSIRVTRLRSSAGNASLIATLLSSGAMVAASRASKAPSSPVARTATGRAAGLGSERTTTPRSFPASSPGAASAATRRGASAGGAAM
jgi:hypothetical protein